MNRRIAVTGVGIVSALARNATETFERLVNGERGFSEITLFDTRGQRSRLAGEVMGLDVGEVAPKLEAFRYSRTDALALAAARDALSSAGLAAGMRDPLFVTAGVTTAGMLESEAVLAELPFALDARSERSLLSYPLSSTVGRLSEAITGVCEVATICSACSSGANAIIQGVASLLNGRSTRVLAGGADGLCRLTLTGFNALGATDSALCRPFDRRRAGLTLGEGAAFLVLEREEAARARDARVLAWLSGWAVGAEAFHVTHPETSGRVASGLIEGAMRRAGLSPSELDYINAHGTGTVPNDAIETLAIRHAFGADADRVLVSSSKGQIGHTLGAAGAIEAAITVLSLDRQIAPPTGGLEEPDDACRLRHVMGRGLRTPLRSALSSSFGFGGTGAVLLFERADAQAREPDRGTSASPIAVTGAVTLGPRGIVAGADNAEFLKPERAAPETKMQANLSERLDPAKSRRFDAQATLVVLGAEVLLREANLPADRVGLISGTAFGNVDRMVAFVQTALRKGPRRCPPAEFPHLVPSAPAGNASIYLGLSGPVLATSDLAASAEAALTMACDWIDAGIAHAFVAGSAEPFDAAIAAVLGPVCESEGTLPRSEGAASILLESRDAATARGARVFALVRERYQIRMDDMGRARIRPPQAGTRAVVIVAQNPGRLESLLARSGWGNVEIRSVVERTGWHEAVGGFALASAVALVMEGEVDEALVIGQTAARAYLVHLTSPR